jgi:aldehyde:ferredoxin oxidoreductase
MLGGYAGKLLKVDLSSGCIEPMELPEDVLRRYLGGCGLGAYLFGKFASPKDDPYAPHMPLMFLTGPLTGTPVLCSGRHSVVAKSPLTGIWGEASSGGKWGSTLKHAGFDGVIFIGRSEEPVYLLIDNGSAKLVDASQLWGLGTYEISDYITERHGKDFVTSCIGPAGENLVPLACIISDGREARAAGRGGLGAVMGSKMLKAVAVRGNIAPPISHPEELRESVRKLARMVARDGSGLREYGTSSGTVPLEASGDMPSKNWKGGRWQEGAKAISGMELSRMFLKKPTFCARCVIGCGRDIEITEGPYAGVSGAGPEYEGVALLGALSEVDDLAAICKANDLCNQYGIDVMSVGGVIAFAREAYEHGYLQDSGLDLSWGNADSMIELIEMITFKKGIGELLGKGVKVASEELGQETEEFAIHVKGMELPAHDPRAYQSVGLGYATSNRGACHLQAWSGIFENRATMPSLGYEQPLDRFAAEGKAKLVFDMQNLMSMFDSLSLCKYLIFGGVKVPTLVRWTNLVTGWSLDQDEFMEIGERTFNAKRLFNVQCGISSEDDILPKRILTQPKESGEAAGHLSKLDKMLPEYYSIRGWDDAGRPRPDLLHKLRMEQA